MSETNTLALHVAAESETARISLLVPKELRDELDRRAASERRSLSAQCVLLIERGMQSDGAVA